MEIKRFGRPYSSPPPPSPPHLTNQVFSRFILNWRLIAKLFVHYAVLLFCLMDFEVYGVSFLTKTQDGKNKTIWSLCFV
jgi:hypothetical protein